MARPQPFSDSAYRTRAKRVWIEAGLTPVGFHEARHTYASLMIVSGVTTKTLATMMGDSSMTITLDRYGHVFPGAEAEAAAKLDAYLQTVESDPSTPRPSPSIRI
jgi:integrase